METVGVDLIRIIRWTVGGSEAVVKAKDSVQMRIFIVGNLTS